MNRNIACNGRIPFSIFVRANGFPRLMDKKWVGMFDLHWRVSKFNKIKAGFYIKKYFDNYNKALATKKK